MPSRIAGPCPSPGCPNRAGQCQRHKPASRQDRGYDADHDALGRDYQQRMDNGQPYDCWRCGKPLGKRRGIDWDLGHRSWKVHAGPECIPCNRGTAKRR